MVSWLTGEYLLSYSIHLRIQYTFAHQLGYEALDRPIPTPIPRKTLSLRPTLLKPISILTTNFFLGFQIKLVGYL
jgi:hypothetical protein